MPRFAANLTMLFTDVAFMDRFAAAAKAGFKGVEYLFPYDYDKRELRQRLEEHQLTQVLHNLPAGDWSGGERGIGCHPGRTAEFAEGVETAIDYAGTLGCRLVNCLAGITPPGVDEEEARRTFVANLKLAARRLQAASITLVIEAINTRDVPGFFLRTTDQALEIIEAVGSDNLFLQYDVYHMQIMEGDLTHRLDRHRAMIKHIQIADTPGRHEPGSGEINFDFLFGVIDRTGYQGWVGCEYRPAEKTEPGLKWLNSWTRRTSVNV